MSYLKYYAGQNGRGALFYVCDSLDGVFIWGPQGWIASEAGTVKETLRLCGVTKAEKIDHVDMPLFMFRSPYGS